MPSLVPESHSNSALILTSPLALASGTRLGPYDVTAQIGVGGTGGVYRETDTNLNRSGAIKVLPASVAVDAERLARVQREAKKASESLLGWPDAR